MRERNLNLRMIVIVIFFMSFLFPLSTVAIEQVSQNPNENDWTSFFSIFSSVFFGPPSTCDFKCGTVTIENGNFNDAYAVISNGDNKVIKTIYVKRGEEKSITGICNGRYYLFFKSGDGWNEKRNEFVFNQSIYKFEDPFDFTVFFGKCNAYSVTLYTVKDGNAATKNINPKDFPK